MGGIEANDALQLEWRMNRLQARYIEALDGKRMPAWLETFSARPESRYACTSAENDAADLPVALMLDDCRARLADRVSFVDKVWAGTFQDYRTRHFVQLVRCERIDHGHYRATSNFSVMFTPEEAGDSRLLACGTYRDELVVEDGELRFLSKEAVTDTLVLPRYVVYPL